MLRDGGFDEFQAGGTPDVDGTSGTGDLARRYVGIVSLGDVNSGAQLYYQRTSTEAAQDFVFDDEVNIPVQILGNSAINADRKKIKYIVNNKCYYKKKLWEQKQILVGCVYFFYKFFVKFDLVP